VTKGNKSKEKDGFLNCIWNSIEITPKSDNGSGNQSQISCPYSLILFSDSKYVINIKQLE
jgi:hypothetical protein